MGLIHWCGTFHADLIAMGLLRLDQTPLPFDNLNLKYSTYFLNTMYNVLIVLSLPI